MNDASAKTALIVGASRGLGLGLARELAERGWKVTATTRGGTADGLDGVTIKTLEINDGPAASAFAQALAGEVFDVVFINAGITGPKNFDSASEAEIAQLFMTNAVSPVRLAELLAPTLRPGTGVLAFMTSLLGSIASNVNGAPALYGASKAALNHLTRGFVAALPKDNGITVLSMHPGWVRTDMGGQNAPLDVATSVKGMVDVLETHAGKGGLVYLDYQGKTIPW
jgi:NAD(P)-dependent dehydrogenase (short-subunit alcohol dehydrogenase family)